MSLIHTNLSNASVGQTSPVKTLEGFYGLMMPFWAQSSNSFEKSKKLHEELIELMQVANEQATDRVVNAIDQTKPNELIAAMTIAYQSFGQANLMIYNTITEQHHQLMDYLFQIIDRGYHQASKGASQII